MLDRAQAAGVEKDPGAYEWTARRWLMALSPRRQTEGVKEKNEIVRKGQVGFAQPGTKATFLDRLQK